MAVPISSRENQTPSILPCRICVGRKNAPARKVIINRETKSAAKQRQIWQAAASASRIPGSIRTPFLSTIWPSQTLKKAPGSWPTVEMAVNWVWVMLNCSITSVGREAKIRLEKFSMAVPNTKMNRIAQRYELFCILLTLTFTFSLF